MVKYLIAIFLLSHCCDTFAEISTRLATTDTRAEKQPLKTSMGAPFTGCGCKRSYHLNNYLMLLSSV